MMNEVDTRLEAYCDNPDCPANKVWVILVVNQPLACDTCGRNLVGLVDLPKQKMADPNAELEKEPFGRQA